MNILFLFSCFKIFPFSAQKEFKMSSGNHRFLFGFKSNISSPSIIILKVIFLGDSRAPRRFY